MNTTATSMRARWATNALIILSLARKETQERVESALTAWMKAMLATFARSCVLRATW